VCGNGSIQIFRALIVSLSAVVAALAGAIVVLLVV
jgi:hypothetical protein